jgi:hypothetical protein
MDERESKIITKNVFGVIGIHLHINGRKVGNLESHIK